MIDLDRIRSDFQNFGVAVGAQVLSDETKAAIEIGLTKIRSGIDCGSIQRSARFVSGAAAWVPEIYEVYKSPTLVEIAKTLLGTPNVCLYMNRLLLKDASWNDDVSIHQDAPYFSGTLEKVTIFVPLRATGRSRGGLIFVKGSHKYGCLARGTVNRDVFANMDDFAPELEIGDVVIMDHLTWHYSDKSRELDERPLLQITYQSAADGSYSGAGAGVATPTLVAGTWQTQHFAPLVGCVRRDS